MFFSSFLHRFPHYRIIAAGLLFFIAFCIYKKCLVVKPRVKAEEKILKLKRISKLRFMKLIGIGFLAAFATVIDDIVAYSALFVSDGATIFFAIAGILAATLVEITLVIMFSEKLAKVRFKEEIAATGLTILGILLLAGFV